MIVENAVEFVVYPACSKLYITSPIVSEPLDHKREDTVSSVRAVRKTKNAPLNKPGKISGIKIFLHLWYGVAPLVLQHPPLKHLFVRERLHSL